MFSRDVDTLHENIYAENLYKREIILLNNLE